MVTHDIGEKLKGGADACRKESVGRRD